MVPNLQMKTIASFGFSFIAFELAFPTTSFEELFEGFTNPHRYLVNLFDPVRYYFCFFSFYFAFFCFVMQVHSIINCLHS